MMEAEGAFEAVWRSTLVLSEHIKYMNSRKRTNLIRPDNKFV